MKRNIVGEKISTLCTDKNISIDEKQNTPNFVLR
jgi:hypothetical protein